MQRQSAFYLDQLFLAAVDDERGQHTCVKSACVDIDTIRHDLGDGNGCMAVDDQLGVKPDIVEKIMPDPYQVRRVLLLQRYSGPDAGVAEEKIAMGRRKRQVLEELDMGLRYHAVQRNEPGVD